jgi:hypothetical protein
MSPHGDEILAVCEQFGATHRRLEYEDNLYRIDDATRAGFALATAPIVGRVDDDTVFTDGFFRRVEALLGRYRNLVMWGNRIIARVPPLPENQRVRYIPSFDHGSMEWSTEQCIRPQWHSLNADGNVFLRREFYEAIGGWPEGVGYGHSSDDFVKRVILNGGVSCIFADLIYIHQDHSYDSRIAQDIIWTDRTPAYPDVDMGALAGQTELEEICESE